MQGCETQARVALIRQSVRIAAMSKQSDDANVCTAHRRIMEWGVSEAIFRVQLNKFQLTSKIRQSGGVAQITTYGFLVHSFNENGDDSDGIDVGTVGGASNLDESVVKRESSMDVLLVNASLDDIFVTTVFDEPLDRLRRGVHLTIVSVDGDMERRPFPFVHLKSLSLLSDIWRGSEL